MSSRHWRRRPSDGGWEGLSVRPEMKPVISMGYRRPRESGGPGEPFEPSEPWVPAFAGKTNNLLARQESFRDARTAGPEPINTGVRQRTAGRVHGFRARGLRPRPGTTNLWIGSQPSEECEAVHTSSPRRRALMGPSDRSGAAAALFAGYCRSMSSRQWRRLHDQAHPGCRGHRPQSQGTLHRAHLTNPNVGRRPEEETQ
jgi:hypothetical protein